MLGCGKIFWGLSPTCWKRHCLVHFQHRRYNFQRVREHVGTFYKVSERHARRLGGGGIGHWDGWAVLFAILAHRLHVAKHIANQFSLAERELKFVIVGRGVGTFSADLCGEVTISNSIVAATCFSGPPKSGNLGTSKRSKFCRRKLEHNF